jgi:hypothetical protein
VIGDDRSETQRQPIPWLTRRLDQRGHITTDHELGAATNGTIGDFTIMRQSSCSHPPTGPGVFGGNQEV